MHWRGWTGAPEPRQAQDASIPSGIEIQNWGPEGEGELREEALRPQELMRDSRRRKSQQLRLGTEWKLRCGAGQELHPKTPFPSRLWAHARFTSGNVVLLQAHLLLAGARKDPELIIDAEWWYQGAVGR